MMIKFLSPPAGKPINKYNLTPVMLAAKPSEPPVGMGAWQVAPYKALI